MKKYKVKEVGLVFETIKAMSNEEYQRRIWVNHEDPNIVDSYDDTTMYFLEDAYPIIEDTSDMIISDKQYQILKTLYQMVDEYDDLEDRPDTDEGIVNDPRWGKVREYAKLVYEELKKS